MILPMTAGTLHGTLISSNLGKEYNQVVYSHLAYLTYMQSTSWEETQAGIKIAGRNINSLRYADDTTLMAEIKEELKRLLMKVQEEREKDGLKLNIWKITIMVSGPITSWQIDGEKVEAVTDSIFLDLKITAGGSCSHEI